MPPKDFWTTEEKRRLIMLLEVYPLYAYKSIAKKIQTKSVEEVRAFIEKMKYSVLSSKKMKSKHDQPKPVYIKRGEESRAPLELCLILPCDISLETSFQDVSNDIPHDRIRQELVERDIPNSKIREWLDMCSRLVENDQFDMSSHLSKVMTIIANFEDIEQTDKHPQVDYSSIYRYLAQLLQGNRTDDLESLGPLESSVMLNVIHSLMDVLSGVNLTVQKNVMLWKCKLLDNRDEDGRTRPDSMKKAAENDFTAFIEEEDQKMTEKLNMLKARLDRLNEKLKSRRDSIKSGNASIGVGDEELTPVDKHTTVDRIITETVETDERGYTKERTKDKDMITFTTPGGHLYTYKRSWKSKPGRKRKKRDDEEEPVKEPAPTTDIVVVMPPKHMQIKQLEVRPKNIKKVRKDGKYKSLKQIDIEEMEGDSVVINQERTQIMPTLLNDKSLELIEEEQVNATVRLKAATEMFDKNRSKYRELQDSVNKSKSKKKPKLYTINPFCVPISLLDLSSD